MCSLANNKQNISLSDKFCEIRLLLHVTLHFCLMFAKEHLETHPNKKVDQHRGQITQIVLDKITPKQQQKNKKKQTSKSNEVFTAALKPVTQPSPGQ